MLVFPIRAGAKFPPLVKDWPAKAKPREQWNGAYAGANWGLHCKGLLVVDVDPRSGGDATFRSLDMMFGFPETRTVRTPSGGVHLHYRMPAGQEAPNSAGKLGPGIDTKGLGGYVLAAGSKTEAGEYVLERDLTMAPAPEWVMGRLGSASEPKAKAPPVDVPDAIDATVEAARLWLKRQPVGEGAYATACGLRDIGVSEAQAADLMADHDPRPNVPEKVRHAYDYAQNDPGNRIASVDDFDVLAPPPPPPPPKGAVRLSAFAGGAEKPPGYVVKGLLSKRSYTLLYGPPGAGKTFVALDLAYHVAAGLDWMERKVRAGPALYLPYEGKGGLRNRAKALLTHGPADVPLFIHDGAFNLRTPDGRRGLGAVIAELPAKPHLIVFDTFAHALCGGDENSAQDVGAFNAGVQALIEATGACVMVLHHPTKNGETARGSGALLGAVDTEIKVDDRQVQPTKQRDMELGKAVTFKLVPVAVDLDEDGDTVMSCVVEPDAARVADPTTKLKGKYRAAWEKLCELRPDNKPVTDAQWMDACSEFIRGRTSWWDTKNRLKRELLIEMTDDGLIRRRLE